MPQPFRNWYFEPDPVPPEAERPGDDDRIARAIAYVSPTSLQRHGARTLNPSAAPTIPGAGRRGWGRTPSSTRSKLNRCTRAVLIRLWPPASADQWE